jgi:hypothetical protein
MECTSCLNEKQANERVDILYHFQSNSESPSIKASSLFATISLISASPSFKISVINDPLIPLECAQLSTDSQSSISINFKIRIVLLSFSSCPYPLLFSLLSFSIDPIHSLHGPTVYNYHSLPLRLTRAKCHKFLIYSSVQSVVIGDMVIEMYDMMIQVDNDTDEASAINDSH